MTNREAYVMGWVYGLLTQAIQEETKPEAAAARPYSGLAEIINKAHQKKVLPSDLDTKIAAALWEVKSIEPILEGGSEQYQPLEIQGSWQLGYFRGLSGGSLPDKPQKELQIKELRKQKGLTQQALADQLGVAQTLVSSWEQGKCKPAAELVDKIRLILE